MCLISFIAQAVIADQARAMSERLADADRIKNGAVQEAAFYRAKLSAFESGSGGEVNRLERDRANHLEQQLQTLLTERATTERKLEELQEAHTLQVRLRDQAEERTLDASRRAEMAEAAHDQAQKEHASLREQTHATEYTLRDHAERLVTLTSTTQQQDAELNATKDQIEELLAIRDQHQRALEQSRVALEASGSRATEMDEQWQSAKKQVAEMELEIVELRNELESRVQEADTARSRLADVENAWTKSREEADHYRSLTTGGLGKLLDTHREIQANDDRAIRGHAERTRAMELEATSLRKMLKEAGQRVDTTQANLSEAHDRNRLFETDLMSTRAQVSGLRSQLAVALSDTGRLRKDLLAREAELRDKSRLCSETETRLGMLKNYLADAGLMVDEDDLSSSQASGSGGSRLQQLQTQLQQSKQAIEDLEMRCHDALREKADSDSQVRLMSGELDRLRSGTSRSPSAEDHSASARALAAERKLAESDASHREKLQRMEQDYQTAVHYVKYVVCHESSRMH